MFKSRWSLVVFVFLLGFLVSWTINSAILVSGSLISEDQLSPRDRITESQIEVFDDKVVLNVAGATWASFTDTNSMDPSLDIGANALQLIPRQANDVSVGDIISYINEDNQRIIHRVVYKGADREGVYFIVKGDNNRVSDPGKIRFEQIDRVLFAIIY
jgi:hypothetical protein